MEVVEKEELEMVEVYWDGYMLLEFRKGVAYALK